MNYNPTAVAAKTLYVQNRHEWWYIFIITCASFYRFRTMERIMLFDMAILFRWDNSREGISFKVLLILSFIMIIIGTLLLTYSVFNDSSKQAKLYYTLGGFFCLFLSTSFFIVSWHHSMRSPRNDIVLRVNSSENPSSRLSENMHEGLPPSYNDVVKTNDSESQETLPSYNTAIQILSVQSLSNSPHLWILICTTFHVKNLTLKWMLKMFLITPSNNHN